MAGGGPVERARADNQSFPGFFLLYPDLALRPAAEWPAPNQKGSDGLAQLAEVLRASWGEMQAERRANGRHAKFCGE